MDDGPEDDPKEYTWESGYEKTWEAITEDSSGRLEPSITDMIMKAKRKRLLEKEASIRLGIMRHVYIIIDMSNAMNEQDLKPTRQLCTIKILEDFIPEFHEQNPISQLGIIVTHNKTAKRQSELSNNAQKHLETLKRLKDQPCNGEPSLQNSLEVALVSLKHLPPHTSREIIIISAALTTCDPGEIHDTLNKVKSANIRVSVLGLAAELRIAKTIAMETGGTFVVCLNDVHFKDLLSEQLEPPPASQMVDHTLIKVGFPHQINTDAKPALCMCHLDSLPSLNTHGYYCPHCAAKYCDLPAECKICGLMLVTAPHLARSYRHLFPLKHFQEVAIDLDTHTTCYGCIRTFTDTHADSNVYICSSCQNVFCFDCDIFLHDTVHSCPGCASNPVLSQEYAKAS